MTILYEKAVADTESLVGRPAMVRERMAIDLYRPKNNATPLPAIVCIHGGASVAVKL
jgi:acetyl esterase/lipase